MPTPSPIMVVRLSTKTDIGVTSASSPMMARATKIASTPTATGSSAATSAPKASTSTSSVSGSTRISLRRLSSALTLRMSRSSGARPVTATT